VWEGPTELKERSAFSEDDMGIRQRRRLPEIGEIAENGLPLELPCQPCLTGSAQLYMPPPRGSGRA